MFVRCTQRPTVMHNDDASCRSPSSCSVSILCRQLLSAQKCSTLCWGSPYLLTPNLDRTLFTHCTNPYPQADSGIKPIRLMSADWLAVRFSNQTVHEKLSVWAETSAILSTRSCIKTKPPAYRQSRDIKVTGSLPLPADKDLYYGDVLEREAELFCLFTQSRSPCQQSLCSAIEKSKLSPL